MKSEISFSVLRQLGVLFEAPGAGELAELPELAPPAPGTDHAFHARVCRTASSCQFTSW